MKKIDPACAVILFAPIVIAVALFTFVAIMQGARQPPADPGFTSSLYK